tara:strand:+ start:1078 stop:1257 length:180 start_codon:yes stop_codon:yes gene_type:complete
MKNNNNLKHSSFKDEKENEVNNNIHVEQIQVEKVLCNHCGRTAVNGIRCLGICVADNDY